jgi:hypothetical protein
MQNNRAHLGFKRIAVGLSDFYNRPITPKMAADWARKGVYRTHRVGRYHSATDQSLQEDLSPATKTAGD